MEMHFKFVLHVSVYAISLYFIVTTIIKGNRLIREYDVKRSEFFSPNPPAREKRFHTERRSLFMRGALALVIFLTGNIVIDVLYG